jgi:hypothetical protein
LEGNPIESIGGKKKVKAEYLNNTFAFTASITSAPAVKHGITSNSGPPFSFMFRPSLKISTNSVSEP